MNFEDSIMQLKGIGEKNAALFRKLNIETIGDLLFHFPKGYETYPPCETIAQLMQNGKTRGSIFASISSAPTLQHIRGLSILKFQARDTNGDAFTVTFFNMPYLKKTLKAGNSYVFYGNLTIKNKLITLSHPKMFALDAYEKLNKQMLPVYIKTKGLTNEAITKYVKLALKQLTKPIEYLPQEILNENDFYDIKTALEILHCPSENDDIYKARDRFAYEEFLLFLLAMKSQSSIGSRKCQYEMIETADADRFIEALPYKLTKSQSSAFLQIKQDMLSGNCMNRLLQGDVGSGKTIVAILALLLCVSNGYQGAFMAPTEVLATQHMETITQFIQRYKLPFKPVLLTGYLTAKQKRDVYEKIANHTYNLVIGTHAIIQDKVIFDKLALVVTDEQHRFGVKQRDALASKGGHIHTIVMSATPIPRSLGMILYGDMDIIEMKEMPSNRLPIKNCVVDQNYRPNAYHFMQTQIEEGHQVYIICPMAQPGVMEELENVVDYANSLKAVFPEQITIAYLHGKMKPKEKNDIMSRFANHEIDILVSTTVIEVGINVPNATVMMVENAERFGLAALHQIRGRVGRGDAQSYCIFMQSDQSKKKNERLSILNHSNDGFEIANEDLKLRGPGDFMGIAQSGSFQFKYADIYQDAQMLKKASMDVKKILDSDPKLEADQYKIINERLNHYLDNGYLDIL